MKSEMSDLTKKLVPIITPLKTKEERAAIEAARAYVAHELSDRHRIFGAELRIEKPSDTRTSPRRAIGVLIEGEPRAVSRRLPSTSGSRSPVR